MAVPSTTERTLDSIVRELDPDYDKQLRRPIVFEFSNGRTFERRPDPYN